jgi:hypothetical protein
MIGVISLGLLGIWTVILGIFNLFGATDRSDLRWEPEQLKKARVSLAGRKFRPGSREPASISRPIRSEAKRSEVTTAFKDLWNEIVGGS